MNSKRHLDNPLVYLLPMLTLVVGLGVAGSVHADIISDEEASCRDKKEGDPCEADSKSGTCAKSKCGKNDYSDGPPPKRTMADCLVCTPGAAKEAAPAKEATPAKTDTPAKEAAPAKTDTKESGAAKGCSSAGGDGSSWLVASVVLGLGLVGFARRR